MKFTLDQINSLQTITTTGSFSAAARQLNKAQSAVSYDIKQMEDRLGITLFNRQGHRARLTQEGEAILAEGRLLLARASRIVALADGFRGGWEPRLEVIIDGIMPMEPIMRVLKTLVDEDVPTQIQTRVEFLRGVQTRFERDKADMMLVKDYRMDRDMTAVPLPRIENVLVAAPEHPLIASAKEKKWELVDLRAHIHVAVHDSGDSTESQEQYLFGGARVYFLSDFFTKHRAILMGLGFGWMPFYLVRDDLEGGRLVEVPFSGETRFDFIPQLVYPANRPLGRAGERFHQLLLEYYPKLSTVE